MTATYYAVLQQPHMEHLSDHPAILTMPMKELVTLEKLMRFCAAHSLTDPAACDISAFAELCGQGNDDLQLLIKALNRLEIDHEFLAAIADEARMRQHREEFSGISYASRPKERSVSVSPDNLPQDWQKVIASLREEARFASSVLDRMEQRLCMFVWSAQRAAAPVDLTNVEALQAFYHDIRQRSAEKNNNTPRFSYLRSTWEELERFARASGIGEEARQVISATLLELRQREQKQTPLKFAKVAAAPTLSELISIAKDMLAAAHESNLPQKRHAGRNAAAAIALGTNVTARPEDVHLHHVFGKGIFFVPERGSYRFCYRPSKTRSTIPEPIDLTLDPFWNKWLDAVILQDHDPSWLDRLRQHVVDSKRSLYVNYDGSVCSPSFYSRIWHTKVNAGGHLTRTLIYDEMADLGEFGIRYGKLVNHHRSDRIPQKYRSSNAIKKSVNIGQEAMIARRMDDDISDLL